MIIADKNTIPPNILGIFGAGFVRNCRSSSDSGRLSFCKPTDICKGNVQRRTLCQLEDSPQINLSFWETYLQGRRSGRASFPRHHILSNFPLPQQPQARISFCNEDVLHKLPSALFKLHILLGLSDTLYN